MRKLSVLLRSSALLTVYVFYNTLYGLWTCDFPLTESALLKQ